jgi:hypothetical protein
MPTVTEIETMNRAALCAAWTGVFATPVPKRLSRPFLRRLIAFEVQARQAGGLPKGFADRLAKAAAAKVVAPVPALRPGGRLVRQWNGVCHVVDVAKDGFMWNGQRHSSLSAIARAITGARWSGPRFFGLTGSAAR